MGLYPQPLSFRQVCKPQAGLTAALSAAAQLQARTKKKAWWVKSSMQESAAKLANLPEYEKSLRQA